tara:strand:+ start:7187 stop:8023 length:837 start_codon:yes stop_codon:yes gene_type:complete
MKFLFSFFLFFRPLNIALGVFTSWVVYLLIGSSNIIEFYNLNFIIICYMSGANILNDFLDINIDKLNKPNRFLVKYPFTQKYIYILIIVLFFIGSWKAWQIYPLAKNIALFFVLPLLIFYEIILKKIPLVGNIVISLLVGSVFLYTEAGLTNQIIITWKIFILAFFLNLIREIIKDLEDIYGDHQNNIQTFPIVYGQNQTIILIRALSLIFILISVSPLYIFNYSMYYIPLIFFSIHIPLLYIIWGLRVNITTTKLHFFSNILKVMIANGIIIILLSY